MYKPEKYIQQLAEYFKKNLAKGYTLDSLKVSLVKQGYSRIAIEKAIELANQQLADKAPSLKERPEITTTVIEDSEVRESFWGKLKKIFKK
jgi:hypothetical protein